MKRGSLKPQVFEVWQWKAVVEQKAHRGRLWKMLGKDQLIHGMCEYFSLARAKAKTFIKDAEKEKQEGYKANRNVSLLPRDTWNR